MLFAVAKHKHALTILGLVLISIFGVSTLGPSVSAQTSWSQIGSISWVTTPTSAQESSGAACESSSATWCFSLQDKVALAETNGTGIFFQSVIQFDSSNTHNCVEDVQIYWVVGTHTGHQYANCYSTNTGYTDSYQFVISGSVNGQTFTFSSASIKDTSTGTQLTMPSGVSYPMFSNILAVWFQLYPFCYGSSCGTNFQPSSASSSSSMSISGLSNDGWGAETQSCTPTYCSLVLYFLQMAGTSNPGIYTAEHSNLQCYSISNDASTTETTFNCPAWHRQIGHPGQTIGVSLPVPCEATGTCVSSSGGFTASFPKLLSSDVLGASEAPINLRLASAFLEAFSLPFFGPSFAQSF